MNYARRLDRRAASRAALRAAVKDQFRRGLLAERLEPRALMAVDAFSPFLASSQSPYWNATSAEDVTDDGVIAPNDVLAIINTLNSEGAHQLPTESAEGESSDKLYIDVNNDGYVSSGDALAVINYLNAEGEPPDSDDKVEYLFSATSPFAAGTTSLGSVRVGAPFDLVMRVDDLRPAGLKLNPLPPPTSVQKVRGVFAAYTDVLFNTQLITLAVSEQQDISFLSAPSTTGTFRLTIDGKQTADINYNLDTVIGREQTAADIATALNAPAVLGAGSVRATVVDDFTLRVRFVGLTFLNQNQSLLTTNDANITVSEIVPGNSTDFMSAVDIDPDHTTGPTGELVSDRFNGLGSTYSGPTAPPGAGANPREFLRVHMIARLPGTQTSANLVFTPSFADLIPTVEETSVLANQELVATDPRESSEVLPTQIAFNTVTIGITSGIINVGPDAATIDEGGTATVNVVGNDTLAPGTPGTQSVELRSVSQASVLPAGAGTVTAVGGQAVFVPAENFNSSVSGPVTFTYVVGQVNNSNTADEATGTVTVTVNAVNDGPVVNLPATSPAPTEDTEITINGISITDVDANDAATNPGVQVTVSSATGVVSLSGTTGLTFTTGDGTSDPSMTFRGPTGSVNAALAGLKFKGNSNVNGPANIVFAVTDNGNTGSGVPLSDTKTLSFSITAVNDLPENRVDGVSIINGNAAFDQLTSPGVPLEFSDANDNRLSVFDAEANGTSATLSTTLSLGAGQGTLTIGGTTAVSIPLSGTQDSINAQLATVTYTPPNPTFTGPATLTIVSDDNGAAAGGDTTSTVLIKLDPGTRPFAVNDTLTITEGTTAVQTINALANDFTATIGTTSITTVNDPPSGQGTADLVGGQIQYTPPGGDFFTPPGSPVAFTYVIDGPAENNPTLEDRTGTVFITITNVNDAPVGVVDSFDVAVGQTTTIPARGVLANDTDIDDAATTLTAVNAVIAAGQGSVTLRADGGFDYTPPGSTGTFTFTYQARDPGGETSAATTVTMRVAGPPSAVNDPPTGTHLAQEDGGPQSFPSVLTNDDDGDPTQSIALTATLVNNVPAAAGSVSLNPTNGTFTYTPAPNFNTNRPGPDSPITFTYKALAGTRESNIATVSITVNERNDDPTAANDTFLAVKRSGSPPNEIGVGQVVPVLGNDSFAPDTGETLTVTGVGTSASGPFGAGPVNATGGGSVRVDATSGQILYDSPTTAPTSASFFYQISDGRGGTAVARVDVSVVDFVPKVISGTVFVDSDGDGVLDPEEKRLANVEVRLTGTSFDSATNNNVDITVSTDINGVYSFGGVGSSVTIKPPKAGTNYVITQGQPLYLLNGLDTSNSTDTYDHDGSASSAEIPVVSNANRFDNAFLLTWNVTDAGNSTGLNFGERGVDVAALNDASGFMQEFLASSGSHGIVATVHANGVLGESIWNWNLPGWENAKTVNFNLSSDLSTLVVSGTDKQDRPFSVTLFQGPYGPRFRVLGIGQNGQHIIRIDGTAAECGADLRPALAFSAGGEGEGSAAEFAAGADALFAGGAWA